VSVASARELQYEILKKKVGDQVNLGIWRSGKKLTLALKTEELPAETGQAAASPAATPPSQSNNTTFGVEVQDLTPDLKRELALKSDTGVVVTDVAPNSPAAVADIQPGDVITELGRTAVLNLDAFQKALSEQKGKTSLLLLLDRKGVKTYSIAVGASDQLLLSALMTEEIRKRKARKPIRRFSELGRSQRLRIIHMLKKTQGLAIGELASRLDLSYMGVKQHCEELERQGFLDTRRRPKPIGRPEIVYRLTAKASSFFPAAANPATIKILQAARQLYGPNAPEKLLVALFREKAKGYAERLKEGDLKTRAARLAKLRDEEGCLSEFVDGPQPLILEYHSSIMDLIEAFPLVRRLEKEMFERLLQTHVERHEERASGLFLCTFVLG
jgi:predicted ArsR family transcriptional regulator